MRKTPTNQMETETTDLKHLRRVSNVEGELIRSFTFLMFPSWFIYFQENKLFDLI